MKQKFKVVILLCLIAIIGISSVFTLSACNGDTEPRDVELEVINPNTGEVLKSGDHIVYPGKNTLIEVRIKDKKTGVYLTDDDFPDNTVRGCLTFYLSRKNSDGSYDHNLKVRGEGYYNEYGKWYVPDAVWPQNKPYKGNYYYLTIDFDCKPKNIEQSDFKRKYNSSIMNYWYFYID